MRDSFPFGWKKYTAHQDRKRILQALMIEQKNLRTETSLSCLVGGEQSFSNELLVKTLIKNSLNSLWQEFIKIIVSK